MIREEYSAWINKHYPTPESARLACKEATLEMAYKFPELKRVRGLASVEEPFGLNPTRTPHWWLTDLTGTIIDPTAHQYPTKILSYEEADESLGPPTGRCPNCGGLCYGGRYLCSDKCDHDYMAYLNKSIR